MIRIKNGIFHVTICLLVFGFCNCQSNPENSVIVPQLPKSEMPHKVVESFFRPSNNSESVGNLVTIYPDRFAECLLESPSECSETRQKSQKVKLPENNNLPRFEIIEKNEISLIVRNFSKKIFSRSITLKRKIAEWVKGNEARVRVEVDIDGIREVKDVLLYKETNWQIFEISYENEHLFFATPSENNEISL